MQWLLLRPSLAYSCFHLRHLERIPRLFTQAWWKRLPNRIAMITAIILTMSSISRKTMSVLPIIITLITAMKRLVLSWSRTLLPHRLRYRPIGRSPTNGPTDLRTPSSAHHVLLR